MENQVVDALRRAGWTVAVAESLTGGAVTARLCQSPGTEDLVLGGIVSYATVAKRRVLGVGADDVVTAAAATEMAEGARRLFGADVGLSLTGVAGPEPVGDHPVGTVLVGWCTPEAAGVESLAGAGAPEQIRRAATDEALRVLLAVTAGRTA